MPELPEVETISQQLDQTLKGLKITQIEVLSKKNFVGKTEEVLGKKIVGVERRAKIILIKLGSNKYLAIHLKLTGQLIYREGQRCKPASPKTRLVPRSERAASRGGGAKVQRLEQNGGPFAVCELPNKFTTVIVSFDNGGKLYFNDLRKFGWMKIVGELGEMGKLGPEANDEKKFTLEYFKKVLNKSKTPIKLVIMDQEKLAGVGNIYANEVLFDAGISPVRPSNTLSDEDIKILRDSILRILHEAIKHKGTSDTDEAYRQISGEKGSFQNYLQVYGRDGEKCPKCGGLIKRIKIGGRGTFYCPACQK